MTQPSPPSAQHIRPWLDRLLLRSDLSIEEQRAILHLPGEIQHILPNRDFVTLGEITTHACIVVQGLVGRFEQTASGARQITALHIPGDAADLHSVPVPEAGSALQTLTRSTILRVPHPAITALVDQYPNLALAFWRDTMIDAAILSKWALNIGRAPSRQRVAHLICELSCRYAAIGQDGTSFTLPATQTHLADATSMTNVHLNRTLRDLSDDRLAALKGGVAYVLDWPRLAKVADFSPDYLRLERDRRSSIASYEEMVGNEVS